MYNNRYWFLKKIYPNYVLLFKTSKNKFGYKCFGIDKIILNYIKKYNDDITVVLKKFQKLSINYIIVDNLNIDKTYENNVNRYTEYVYKFIVIDILDRIRAGVLG